MLDTLGALVLGAVEGITEFLPISSTGHLILVSELLGVESTEFLKSFEIAIQLGAILAVVLLYWRKLFLVKGVLVRVIIAFIPTGVLGFLLYPFIKAHLLGNVSVVLWAMLLGGVFLILFEYWYKKRNPSRSQTNALLTEAVHLSHPKTDAQGLAKLQVFASHSLAKGELLDMNITQAVIIGFCQAVSMIPGVSRAAATIVGGLFVGLSREAVVEFSFLLAIPTMAAATGLDLLTSSAVFSSGEWGLLAIGFVSAFVSGILAVKFLLSFIKHHTFMGFGVYRIIAAFIFLLFLF
ncbi:MAG: undecaprenyl-diphosphate phosphatase [bacterium]|nr:undecaprenyl-diphosphate phosphatase [bacterium]